MRTGTETRYVTEWLSGQAAARDVGWDASAGTLALSEEQAFALAKPDRPLSMPGGLRARTRRAEARPRITEAFRTGAGTGRFEHDDDVFVGYEDFFRPGDSANLVDSRIPFLDGVDAKLRVGARVADMGCGLGASAAPLALAYPESTVHGSDQHRGSIDLARKRAAIAGVTNQVSFEVASAKDFSGTGYGLVATFNCLHDRGDPVGAARHVRESPAPAGTSLVVGP